jgi:hypothetical protein
MNAIDFLPNKMTPIQIKIANRKIKEKTKLVNFKSLPDEKKRYIQERVTIANHCIEFLNDLVDEMRNEKIIGPKHLIVDYQAELLKLQEYFIMSAIDNGEEEERLKQQKRFEQLFKKVSGLKAKKLNKLIELIEEL